MSQSHSTVRKLLQVAAMLLIMAAFLSLGGTANASDREDAKALVGAWKYQGFLGDNWEFKADGTYYINGLGGRGTEWTVKGGKLVIRPAIGKAQEYDFTLSPDNNTLRFDGNTYKRK
jgi:hypothetical protein